VCSSAGVPSGNKKLAASVEQALSAQEMPLEQRRERYCFANRLVHQTYIYVIPVFRIHDMLLWIRIQIRFRILDPDPAIFVIDL
jgi:hypothetical protein